MAVEEGKVEDVGSLSACEPMSVDSEGGAGSILTFAVCASSTVFWEPPLGGWQRHRRETDKIIVVLFSIAFELKRLGLRRTRLVVIVICYPRLKTGL